jgi:hypothetical protein
MEEDEVMIRPIRGGVSNINANPIGILEKLGKYEFVYDYSAINRLLFAVPDTLKPLSSNANAGFYNFDGDGTGLTSPINWETLFPQPVQVNPNAQVGVFSKGNIVNVVRFDGNNAIIENINYKAPDSSVEKTTWGELLGGVVNKKELSIPKDYLIKADDTLEPTLLTGINYGANMKPQPFVSYIKPTPQVTTIELNASFVLNKDFQYVSSYGSRDCGASQFCPEDMVAKYATLKAGTKVTGDLIRKPNNNMYRVMAGYPTPPPYNDFLQVKGVGVDGSINIPIEYLTRDVATNTNNNSGVVVPAENNNKNLLMIAGAFLLGYALFSKGDSSN